MRFSESYIADHMQSITGSAIRDIFKYLGKPGMISLAGGNPSNTSFEPEVIKQLAVEAIVRYGTSTLQYGGTEGLMGLREQTAKYLSETAGVPCTAANILPVQGSSQAFDLLLRALINPGDKILVESPTFLGAIQVMRMHKAQLIEMPMDDDGVIVEEVEKLIREHHPKLMYIIPTFQNPTGRTLSLERRKKIAALASEYGVVIAEDDPYRDLRFSGDPLPSIASFDKDNWVVYMSSYSKYISPGMRVGAASVPDAALLRKMVIGKQSADVHSPILTQAIVELYMEKGLIGPHLDSIRAEYKAKLDAMLPGFDLLPEGTTHTVPQGGLFVWAELPENYDTAALFPKAIDANVAFVPGTHFYPEGGHNNTIRLNFSMPDIESIRMGMDRLISVIKNA